MTLRFIPVITLAIVSVATAAFAQQKVDDSYDFKPGDLISLGANKYPAGGVYRIDSCDPVTKAYRECQVMLVAPYKESQLRPLTMNNYTADLTLVGRAEAPPAPALQPRPQPAVQLPTPPQPPAAPARPTTEGGGACPRSTYGGAIRGNTPASAALFRQKIIDTMAMGNTPRGWYGVQLANLQVSSPIRNDIGRLPSGQTSLVNNGAPPGVAMYPVSTTMTVCEGWATGSGSWRTTQRKFLCFVSANNEWTCGPAN